MMMNASYSALRPVGNEVRNGEPSASRPTPVKIWGIGGGRDGFLQLATETGVGAFVGSFGPVGPSGGTFALGVHQGLAQGESIAEAVLHARQEALKASPEDPTPLWYVLSGSGDLKLR
jgi:hypothetical protein